MTDGWFAFARTCLAILAASLLPHEVAHAQVFEPALVHAALGREGLACKLDNTCAEPWLGCQPPGICERSGSQDYPCRSQGFDPFAEAGILCDSPATDCDGGGFCAPAGGLEQQCRHSLYATEYGACDDGLECATDKVCRYPLDLGTTCDHYGEEASYPVNLCAHEWLACDTTSWTCRAVGQLGEPCKFVDPTAWPDNYKDYCAPGLACAAPGVCLSDAFLGAEGESCWPQVGPTSCGGSTCHSPPLVGETYCQSYSYACYKPRAKECDGSLQCLRNICQQTGAYGQPCELGTNNCDGNLACIRGTCRTAVADATGGLGESCAGGCETIYSRKASDPTGMISSCDYAASCIVTPEYTLVCHNSLCTHPDTVGGLGQPAINGTKCDEGLFLLGSKCVGHWDVADRSGAIVQGSAEAAFSAINGDSNARLDLYVRTQWPGSLSSHNDRCHIQGFQRLRGNQFVFTANSRDVGRFDSDESKKKRRFWEAVKVVAGAVGATYTLGGSAYWAYENAEIALNDCQSKGDGPYAFFGSVSRAASGTTRWGTSGPNDKVSGSFLVGSGEKNYHPGGFQISGDYMYAGVDGEGYAELRTYHLPVSTGAGFVANQASAILGASGHASAVGAQEIPEGPIMVLVGNLQNSGARDYYFYLIDPDAKHDFVPRLQGQPPQPADYHSRYKNNPEATSLEASGPCGKNFASVNLVRDSGGRMYMLGMGNSKDWPLCATDGGNKYVGTVGDSDAGFATLCEINYEWSAKQRVIKNMTFTHRATKSLRSNGASGCAGTGTYVTDNGRLILYSMEHDSNPAIPSSDGQVVTLYEYPSSGT